jgi:hypothetical protein
MIARLFNSASSVTKVAEIFIEPHVYVNRMSAWLAHASQSEVKSSFITYWLLVALCCRCLTVRVKYEYALEIAIIRLD